MRVPSRLWTVCYPIVELASMIRSSDGNAEHKPCPKNDAPYPSCHDTLRIVLGEGMICMADTFGTSELSAVENNSVEYSRELNQRRRLSRP
jgi:hypothetical protein